MPEKVVLCDIDSRGVATVTINRPEVNNAYNGDVINRLLDGLKFLETENNVRVIVLRGNGRHFQAGADLKWINEVSGRSKEDNILVSKKTTDAIRFLDCCRIPTIALVHGGCFGGGTGIIAACDIVIASKDALFFNIRSSLGTACRSNLTSACCCHGNSQFEALCTNWRTFWSRKSM